MRITIELTKPTAFLRSHIMCDDIAGTSKYAEILLSDVAATIFPTQAQAADAFDDDSVGDEELLAAAKANRAEKSIEVIEDIDTLMRDEKKASGKRKRKASIDDDENEEPLQLANGRWECQHTCKAKGVDCKHKCCKEGVAKPRRLAKKATKSSVDGSQRTLTHMARSQPPSETADLPAEKRRSNTPLSVNDLGFTSEDFEAFLDIDDFGDMGASAEQAQASTTTQDTMCTGTSDEYQPAEVIAQETTLDTTVADIAAESPAPAAATETVKEREKRLFEEDQRRRWAQFEPRMFEEYGEYVILVD